MNECLNKFLNNKRKLLKLCTIIGSDMVHKINIETSKQQSCEWCSDKPFFRESGSPTRPSDLVTGVVQGFNPILKHFIPPPCHSLTSNYYLVYLVARSLNFKTHRDLFSEKTVDNRGFAPVLFYLANIEPWATKAGLLFTYKCGQVVFCYA